MALSIWASVKVMAVTEIPGYFRESGAVSTGMSGISRNEPTKRPTIAPIVVCARTGPGPPGRLPLCRDHHG